MGVTIFAHLLVTERYRQRAARSSGFAIPALQEIDLPAGASVSPVLATNMRGKFLPTRCSSDHRIRYGFSNCSLEEEPLLLRELHSTLSTLSTKEKWGNRCSSRPEAIQKMLANGLQPKTLLLPEEQLPEGSKVEEAREQMRLYGHAAIDVDGMKVLLAPLPSGTSMVVAAPSEAGLYTRVGNYLGLLITRVDRSIMLVEA